MSVWTGSLNAAAHPAEALIVRAHSTLRSDPDASRATAEAALEVLKRKPDVDLEIRARLLLCEYQIERDRAAAVQQLEFAIALLPQAKRPGLRAGVLTCQGDLTEAEGDLTKAVGFLDQAVSIGVSTHDDEMLAGALFSRGALVGIQGEFAKGLADLKQAQSLYERLRMADYTQPVQNNIAILYSRMGDYSEALKIYQAALRAQRRANVRRDLVLTLHNIGRTHEQLRDWPAARQAFDESLTIARELRYQRGEAYALRGVAACVAQQGSPREALDLLDQANKVQKKLVDASLNARIQLTRGVVLHQLRRLNESVNALEVARKYYAHADAIVELSAAANELAEVYAAMGMWRAAYEYRLQAQTIEQKLFRNRFDQRFASLKVEFDTAAREKENAALLRENQANEKALLQERSVRKLQAALIALGVLLVTLLAAVAWHQRRASLSMRGLAMTDELTGVPNRRSALRTLERTLRQADGPCAVLVVDIDHFKSINDQHGHPEGDEALRLIAATLKLLIPSEGSLGRLGGEEFVVILPDNSLAQAREHAEYFRQRIESLDTKRWRNGQRITVSIGVSVSKSAADSATAMLQRADAALYQAKFAGRNCVRTEAEVATSVA